MFGCKSKTSTKDNDGEFILSDGVRYALTFQKPVELPKEITGGGNNQKTRMIPTDVQQINAKWELMRSEDGQYTLIQTVEDFLVADHGKDFHNVSETFYPAKNLSVEEDRVYAEFAESYSKYSYWGADAEGFLEEFRAIADENYQNGWYTEADYEYALKMYSTDGALIKNPTFEELSLLPSADPSDLHYLVLTATFDEELQTATPLEYTYRYIEGGDMKIHATADDRGRLILFEEYEKCSLGDDVQDIIQSIHKYEYDEQGNYVEEFYYNPYYSTERDGLLLVGKYFRDANHTVLKVIDYVEEWDEESKKTVPREDSVTDYFYENGVLIRNECLVQGVYRIDTDYYENGEYYSKSYSVATPESYIERFYHANTYSSSPYKEVNVDGARGVKTTTEYSYDPEFCVISIAIELADGCKELYEFNENGLTVKATLTGTDNGTLLSAEYLYESYDEYGDILKEIRFKDQKGNEIDKKYLLEYSHITEGRAKYDLYDEQGVLVGSDEYERYPYHTPNTIITISTVFEELQK